MYVYKYVYFVEIVDLQERLGKDCNNILFRRLSPESIFTQEISPCPLIGNFLVRFT